MIRIGRESQCLPYAGFLTLKSDKQWKSHRVFLKNLLTGGPSLCNGALLGQPCSFPTLMCRFVLCWSHQQGLWDQRGVFHLYGQEGRPWLTVRLWYWMEQGTVDLWAYFLTGR